MNQLTGPVGRAITIIVVISLGIMLLLGKVTWGVAIALAVGMGIIFRAKDLAGILLGGSTEGLCV
ncbi:MAG: TrbC/VirB2 family protein [Candidatus Midichloria sp.]